ncbi:hypothetical protein Y032_0623g779 [Ancylostoma ceylanicum]|uniref:Uncharacterized protein n=1 Tax=Ancylostoma ceylanicum TaxID=53326 RepID=A0A016WMJ4_9BILA|nr:hypothetical protein Y032_0623g779 [Ancylostoma ceylanicum]
MTDKLREARLRCHGHDHRDDDAAVCEIILSLDVSGRGSNGDRNSDGSTHSTPLAISWHPPGQAHDRVKWRQRISKVDHAKGQTLRKKKT